jgi:protein SCO1
MKPILVRVLVVFLIFFTGWALVNFVLTPAKPLPIFSPGDINPKLVDESLHGKKGKHQVAPFSLTDQDGQTVTEEMFENKIYVADFFFTTCPTICKDMSRNMRRLQDEFKDESQVLFLSHSVTPEMDSVPVLKAYAEKNGAITGKWIITTGDKKHIYELARKSYFAVLTEGDGGEVDFIHTENFVLVDTQGRLRGFYDGTNEDEMKLLIRDIRKLLKEMKSSP